LACQLPQSNSYKQNSVEKTISGVATGYGYCWRIQKSSSSGDYETLA
jgi:hypothetical protein